MKASLLSVGLVFAALALALVAADPVANETEAVALDAVIAVRTKDPRTTCTVFGESLAAGQIYSIYKNSCYYSSQVYYEGSYEVETYTAFSTYDSYSVYYGDQACEGPPASLTYFSYKTAQYSDHAIHSLSFGPHSSNYATFRPTVSFRCDNSIFPCFLTGTVCLNVQEIKFEHDFDDNDQDDGQDGGYSSRARSGQMSWWVILCIAVGALIFVSSIVIVGVVISRRKKKAAVEAYNLDPQQLPAESNSSSAP